jgi:hypothetical protein
MDKMEKYMRLKNVLETFYTNGWTTLVLNNSKLTL